MGWGQQPSQHHLFMSCALCTFLSLCFDGIPDLFLISLRHVRGIFGFAA